MNIHHLELFYYVARHGGISSAVRQMPYGIQQPAVSSQVLQLEKDLGAKLFDRQPFRLTDAGQELFDFIDPFFSNLDAVAQRLRSSAQPQLRVAASEVVLRKHFPAVLERLLQSHPQVRLGLRSGFDTELANWLRDGQADLIITPLHGRPPPQTQSQSFLRLPLVLLVPKKWKVGSVDEIWARRRPEFPLISMPARESISVIFQRGLRRLGVEWPVTIEASSLTLITQYAADGRGIGVTVALPELVKERHVQVLALDGFDRMEVAAVWRGELTPLLREFLAEGARYAREMWPEWLSANPVAPEKRAPRKPAAGAATS